jgi:hypothetical protein
MDGKGALKDKKPFPARPWSLSPEEMAEADDVGDARDLASTSKGDKDKFGAVGGKYIHQLGARGEAVFAKATGLTWHKSINRYNRPDVGDFEVKTRTLHSYDLLVRPKAKFPHALVTGTGPSFIVWGWIDAQNAFRPEWLKNYGADRPPAYFVPKSALLSIDDIPTRLGPGHWTDSWLDNPEEKWRRLYDGGSATQ